MTAMPQLVAAFHSLVGLAAVFVAAGAFYAPEKFGIAYGDNIKIVSAIEMSVGLVIGAITFSGSIIAFHKFNHLTPGQKGIICSFGAGYSICSILLEKE